MDPHNTFWLTISILILAAAVVLWLRQRVKLHRAHSWPMTDGKVLSTVVRIETTAWTPGPAHSNLPGWA
jgi:hypothetical protein